MQTRLPLILAVAVLIAAIAGPGHAVTLHRALTSGPTSYCQSALPVFDGNIRKRPLAVVNEGEGNAFVTCSFPMQGEISSVSVMVFFSTSAGTAATLNCTGVTGYQGSSSTVTKSTVVPANGTQTSLSFLPTDFPGAPALFRVGHFSLSCALPPGVGINDSYVEIREDVGS